MRFLRRFFPKPSRSSTARKVLRLLEAAGLRDLRYDEKDFSLRGGDDDVFFLGNIHRELSLALPWQRGAILRKLASSLLEPSEARLDDFQDVRPRLRPGVRHAFMLEAMRLQAMAEGSKAFGVPFRPLGGNLAVVLNVDYEQSTAVVSESHLQQWGLSFDDALTVATENLERLSAEPLEEVLPGLYHSPWQDCYDPSRLLLAGVLRSLDLDGDPVAIAPNWNHLFITGANSLEGLVGAFVCAQRAQDEESKPMSMLPMVRRSGQWVALELPKGHAAEPLLRKQRVIEMVEIYEQQKQLLDQTLEKDGKDVFVAEYSGLRDEETDEFHSYCLWSKDVVALLPETDQVSFFDDDQPDESKLLAKIDWDIVKHQCEGLMRDTGFTPRRFLVEAFPSREILDTMKGFQQLRS